VLQQVRGRIRHRAELLGLELPEKGQVRKRDIARFLPAAPQVVEVGSHVGLDTEAMACRWPKGTIHAFEPVPALYEQLAARVRRRGNVTTYRLAVAGTSGELTMNLSGGRSDGSSSLLRPLDVRKFHPDVTFEETIAVRSTTLDEWAKQHAVEPDMLWLDAQGAELQILQAAHSTLMSVRAIYTEVSIAENYADGALYPELKSFLRGHGFSPVIERIAWADGGNVLFAR
jgi:FkbM family methyltransferase